MSEVLRAREAAVALVETTEDPMWALDPELRLCTFNHAFAQLVQEAFGVEAQLGSTVADLPEEVEDQHRRAYLHVLSEGALAFDWVIPNTEAVWAVRLTPIMREGSTIGIAATCHDVSDRERVVSELRAARLEAERANAAKSDFLAMISHELRTPLNAIVGLTQVAMERQLDPAELAIMEKVQTNSTSLLHLVTDLLDFSKIEAGLLELDPVTCDIREVVGEVVEFLRVRADQRSLELVFEVADDVPERVEVDPARVRQIVTNLLSNGLRYTPHGRVSVELSWVAESTGPARVQIAVRDTGVGISRRDQKLIFTRFYRAYRSTSERSIGTGLGLAITKSMVELMGGEIRVRSKPGHGSVFSVRLPVRRVEGVDAQQQVASLRRRVRILVADDNPDNVRITAGMLKKQGDDIVTVSDGEAALDACAASDFDLVVMDVDMEPMDGVRATVEIRAREGLLGLQRVPIVALTAHAVPEVRRRCQASGMDDFLTKPVDRDALTRMVERWVDRSPRILVVATDPRAATTLVEELREAGADAAMATTGPEAVSAVGVGYRECVVIGELAQGEGERLRADLQALGFTGPVLDVVGTPTARLIADLQERLTLLSEPPSAAPSRRPVRDVDPDIADLVPEYLEDRREDVKGFLAAIDRQDADWIRKKAHQVRGTGTSYGYPDLTELAATLEQAATDEAWDRIPPLVDRIAAVVAE